MGPGPAHSLGGVATRRSLAAQTMPLPAGGRRHRCGCSGGGSDASGGSDIPGAGLVVQVQDLHSAVDHLTAGIVERVAHVRTGASAVAASSDAAGGVVRCHTLEVAAAQRHVSMSGSGEGVARQALSNGSGGSVDQSHVGNGNGSTAAGAGTEPPAFPQQQLQGEQPGQQDGGSWRRQRELWAPPQVAEPGVWLPPDVPLLLEPDQALAQHLQQQRQQQTRATVSGTRHGHSPQARQSQLQHVFLSSASTAGRKSFMEDAHVMAALDPQDGVRLVEGLVASAAQVPMAAVFDGHAGTATATYAARQFPQLLHAALLDRLAAPAGPPSSLSNTSGPQAHTAAALASSFRAFDSWWASARLDPGVTPHGWDDSGSTAVVVLVSGDTLLVGNAGDSVAMLVRGGSPQRLSEEHRPGNVAEAERVLQAGGRLVTMAPGGPARVLGNGSSRYKGSMVTRSLGDFSFKRPQPLITSEPHVATTRLAPADRLVLLTSDGATDVLSDAAMVELAMGALDKGQRTTLDGTALAKAAASAVVDAALSAGAHDNITVVAMLLDWDGAFT